MFGGFCLGFLGFWSCFRWIILVAEGVVCATLFLLFPIFFRIAWLCTFLLWERDISVFVGCLFPLFVCFFWGGDGLDAAHHAGGALVRLAPVHRLLLQLPGQPRQNVKRGWSRRWTVKSESPRGVVCTYVCVYIYIYMYFWYVF